MELISGLLQSLALLMIAPQIPAQTDSIWQAEYDQWQARGEILYHRSHSIAIVDECRKNPDHTIVTPLLLQGSHQLILDGEVLSHTGDPDFKKASPTYNIATLPCSRIVKGQKLTWEVATATKSLANLTAYPRVLAKVPLLIFFCGPLMLIIAGALAAIALFLPIIFWGKIESKQIFYLVTGVSLYAICYIFTVPHYFDVKFPPLTAQKISDTALWLALPFIFQILYNLGQSTRLLANFVAIFGITGAVIVLLSASLDQLQVGSNFALITITLSILISTLYTLIKNWNHITSLKRQAIEFIVMLIFVGAAVNDGSLFISGIDSVPIFPLGSLTIVVLLSMAVNQLINRTYVERDHLRENLELEVKNKTSELQNTLNSLKEAQADLIQSAKLASVGTLAAGIAHEINNSLNYVNGSIFPLEGWIRKQQISDTEKSRAQELLGLMKDGLKLTFGIITNLKRQTSTHQTESEKLNLSEIIDGVEIILRSKISGIKVIKDIPLDLSIDAHRASLSQILMNLIANAAEALEEQYQQKNPLISIKVSESQENIQISITDNGCGIPQEIQDRIFEPFFTTKPVGKGTGLGLYIVNSEVKKIGGTLSLHSKSGEGTTFQISLPKYFQIQSEAA